MYIYIYKFLELFMIKCHSLAMSELQQNDFFAVKYLRKPTFRHKKSPIVTIWQQGKNIGVIGFEPTASCSQSRRSSQAELHPGNSVFLQHRYCQMPFHWQKTRIIRIEQCILHKIVHGCNKICIAFQLLTKPFS